MYVSDFPKHNEKVQVSKNGGRIPFWSSDRREFFYRTDDQRIWVATYKIQRGRFLVESIKPWPQNWLADTGVLANLDLARDGKHFLLLTPAGNPENQQSQNHVTFMLDFFDELNQLARTAAQ